MASDQPEEFDVQSGGEFSTVEQAPRIPPEQYDEDGPGPGFFMHPLLLRFDPPENYRLSIEKDGQAGDT